DWGSWALGAHLSAMAWTALELAEASALADALWHEWSPGVGPNGADDIQPDFQPVDTGAIDLADDGVDDGADMWDDDGWTL
ncbi:MAG: hypothetical protein IRZ33_11000, partial [Alicyclobacillaceae bacterium]|nr:hypothetical protein [Alicyclobacillaceae bacterium]